MSVPWLIVLMSKLILVIILVLMNYLTLLPTALRPISSIISYASSSKPENCQKFILKICSQSCLLNCFKNIYIYLHMWLSFEFSQAISQEQGQIFQGCGECLLMYSYIRSTHVTFSSHDGPIFSEFAGGEWESVKNKTIQRKFRIVICMIKNYIYIFGLSTIMMVLIPLTILLLITSVLWKRLKIFCVQIDVDGSACCSPPFR